MSFINKSVNYSQTVLLKSKCLAPVLTSYNDHLLQSQKHTSISASIDYHVVPNNNRKFYLYIVKKSILENCTDDYNLLYFFPDTLTTESFSQSKTLAHGVSDFFVEINNTFSDSYLFEGYMYNMDEKLTYLISDILTKNDNVVTCDYALRYTLINENLMHIQDTTNLNNHLCIGIHPMFHCENESMLKIFYNNFIHKNEVTSLETIQNFVKTRYTRPNEMKVSIVKKRIKKGKYTDVYEVFNIVSGNKEGILYIKGIAESKYMKSKFVHDSIEIETLCSYNETFNKWYPILDCSI
jgi:hypothetical protein